MAIVFPASPNVNDTFTAGSITYQCVQNNPTKWIGLGVTPADRLIEGSNSLEITAGNDLVWTGDNVGIKTTDPQSALEVVDNISFTSGDTMPQLRIKATSGAIGKVMNLGLNETDDYGLIQTMDRGTGYSTASILQPYGTARVGIGAEFSDPDAKLEVRDSASQGVIIRATNTQATDANKALRIRNNSDVDTASISHRGSGYFAGNVQFASGSGIDFSANANAAGMTSELLDDYEEGSWTPVIKSGTDTITATGGNQHFTYTKVGNKVTVYFALDGATTAGTTGGDFMIEGLPFSMTPTLGGNRTMGSVLMYYSSGLRAAQWPVWIHLNGGSTRLDIYEKSAVANSYGRATVGQVGTQSYVFGQITYNVE